MFKKLSNISLLIFTTILFFGCNLAIDGEIISGGKCGLEGSLMKDLYDKYDTKKLYLVNKTEDKRITFTLEKTTFYPEEHRPPIKTISRIYTSPSERVELGCSHGKPARRMLLEEYEYEIINATIEN